MKKVKVTFLVSAQSRDSKNKLELDVSRGDTVELEQASADHWINRGKAVEGAVKLDAEEKKKAVPASKQPAKRAPDL